MTWSGAGPALLRAVETHQPDAIIAVGEAGGRAVVTPERWARNWARRIPDNDGVVRMPLPWPPGRTLESRLDPAALTRAIPGRGSSRGGVQDVVHSCATPSSGRPAPTDPPRHPARARGQVTGNREHRADRPGDARAESALNFNDITHALAAAVGAAARQLRPHHS
ncbi:pyroglutamyl-peptidase I [Kocuria rhizophila]|nr:pyroglutamyl-peptidase I [Kocuria rhizophila]